MSELHKYINSYFGITKEEATQITHLFKASDLAKGEFFIQQQQYCEKLSFIHSGFIRVFADFNNKEVTQWVASKGYFITEINSLIFKQRSRWNMQALTDCKLFTIEKKDYDRLAEFVPNWHVIEKKFIVSCFTTLEDRVFSHLSLTAEERYEYLFNNNKEIFKEIPLKFIASMLGISPETLSRIRKKSIS